MRSIDTPEVRARLAELTAAAGGRLTPERVVEDARNESSPLHRLFDWSDAEAAAKWRLEQARMVLRAVRYEYVVQSVSRACVAYVRDPEADAGEQGYVAVSAMRSDQARASVVLAQELMRVRSLVARVRALAMACGQTQDVEAALAMILRGAERVRSRPRAAAAGERSVRV